LCFTSCFGQGAPFTLAQLACERPESSFFDAYNSLIILQSQIIVDFTASWCGPCRVIAPEFERLSTVYTSVIFLKVDVDNVEVGYFD